MQAGYRSLNNEQRKRLEEKAEELDRAKMEPVVGTNARKAVARTYRRKLKTLMSQMHAQLGWDAAIVFSSKFPEDHGKLTRAITNGNTATDALQRMGGGYDFDKYCQETAGPALKRSTTAQKHEISKGMRKLLEEVSGSEVNSFPWNKFVREQRGDAEGGFWYRFGDLAVIGIDYEEPFLKNPSANGITSSYRNALSEGLEKKTIKIVNVNTQ
ncbi:hypothetical protein BJV82DRAFT_586676 [Fennellomyces sp. T-0311]|nr:hypothetical protein BJV82DRAFT_586676 [Fennellomyces sp. T-0311]